VNSTGHLSPELLFGYQHRLLSPEELRSVHAHISVCNVCREQLAEKLNLDAMISDVRSSLASERRPLLREFLPYVAAAAAIVVAVTGSIWLSRLSSQSTATDRGGDEAPAVEAALRAGRIALPGFLNELAPPRETLMGGPRAISARLLTPKATAVLTPSAKFEWEPLAGQWTYQVRIFQLDGEMIVSSPDISGTQWIAAKGLSPGMDYQWQIVAAHGAEHVTLPQPPENPPRFRVLDAVTSERLRTLARLHPRAHLFLGVEYGQAGVLDDARAELVQAARQNSNPDAVHKLLESLQVLQ
jgi:hypothetical protein